MSENSSAFGNKYECFKCGCKFYDLNKPEPICPKCNTNQRNAPLVGQKAPQPREVKHTDYTVKETEYDDEVKSIDGDEFPEIEDFSDDEEESLL